MFVWDLYSGAYPFTENERKFALKYLEILIRECPRDGAFLNLIKLDELEFMWAPKMTVENGIMGAWSLMSPNKIFMQAPREDVYIALDRYKDKLSDVKGAMTMSNFSTDAVVMTMIHELIHKFQFMTCPPLFVINRLVTLFVDKIPFLQEIGIEHDARKNSETPELKEFYKHMCTSFSTYQTAITSAPKHKKLEDHYLYKCYIENTEIPEKYKKYAKELMSIFE